MAEGSSLSVLVVDDERLSRVTMVQQLIDAGHRARAEASAYAALDALKVEVSDVVLTDLRMPGMDGLQLLKRVQEEYPGTDVIMMTAHGSVSTAVEAMQAGAVDYLMKPFRFSELAVRLGRIAELREVRREVAELRSVLTGEAERYGLVARSPAMRQVLDRIELFAAHDAPVLVTGETGTGKEVVTRALHDASPRRKGPFVPVGCASIPENLADSLLFGHERGAFTGAQQRRIGAFERARGGTLLLDDVDDLPPALQGKLLRVLQESVLNRVGGVVDIVTDVRVVATTKVPLDKAVAEGRFRSDLYYRLYGLRLDLPPLRDRSGDALLLALHFLRRDSQLRGVPVPQLSESALRAISSYPWPGNVRQLKHAVEAASALSAGHAIGLEHFGPEINDAVDDGDPVVRLQLEGRDQIDYQEVVHGVERALLQWALEHAKGRQTAAAELLLLKRTTLQSKLHALLPH